jgi:hypothetical protein
VIQPLDFFLYPIRKPVKLIGEPEEHVAPRFLKIVRDSWRQVFQDPAIAPVFCVLYAISSFLISPDTGKSSYNYMTMAQAPAGRVGRNAVRHLHQPFLGQHPAVHEREFRCTIYNGSNAAVYRKR